MDADEPRIGLDEIELDVPPAAADHMDIDRRHLVVRAAFMVLAAALLEHRDDVVDRDGVVASRFFAGTASRASCRYVPARRAAMTLRLVSLNPIPEASSIRKCS